MADLHNFYFPDDYLFYILDPNGGLWLKEEDTIDGSKLFKVGISSLLAEKLENISSFSVSHNNMEITKNSIFLTLQGTYVMEFFSPFHGTIIEINPILNSKPQVSQKSVYDEHWILRLKLDDHNLAKWESPNSKKFQMLVNSVLSADKKLREKCCPDFSDSRIVRRNKGS